MREKERESVRVGGVKERGEENIYIYIYKEERERERERRDRMRTNQKRHKEIVPLGKIEIVNYRMT